MSAEVLFANDSFAQSDITRKKGRQCASVINDSGVCKSKMSVFDENDEFLKCFPI